MKTVTLPLSEYEELINKSKPTIITLERYEAKGMYPRYEITGIDQEALNESTLILINNLEDTLAKSRTVTELEYQNRILREDNKYIVDKLLSIKKHWLVKLLKLK